MELSSSDKQIFFVAFLLRLFLVFCGDIFSPPGVKYEDIDYSVFTNASRHIYEGGTAFDEQTDNATKYRYTPLLAWMLQPNIFLFSEFGKILFITIDIMGAYLLHYIIQNHLQILHNAQKSINAMLWISVLWLFNPMIFTISSRGSCDSVNILLVLLTFYFLLQQQWIRSGIVYGAAVHFRIYPFIYALSFVLFIAHSNTNSLHVPLSKLIYRMILNANVWLFGLMSLLSFSCLNAICFVFMGGNTFINESYLYHFSRIDDHHNFSAYFYFFSLSKLDSYDSLDFMSNCVENVNHDLIAHCIAPLISRFSFIPQFSYIVIVSCLTYKNLHFALFLTTFVFVTFNKVCTSQYFTWYICLLPLVLPYCGCEKNKKATACCISIWFLGNGHWLYWAFRYEIKEEEDKLLMVWMASILFFVINNALILIIGNCYDSRPLLSNYIQFQKKKQ